MAALGAIVGLTAKMNLSVDQQNAKNIDFSYFYTHIEGASGWAYAYWLGVGLFLTGLLIGVLLQWANDRG